MPSSYTANVAFEKPADGEQTGSWGDTVNDNSDIIDRLTSQVGVIPLLGSTYTLTTSTSGALSEGHYSLIRFTGTPGATCTVTINPNTIQRIYTVYNDTNQTLIMAQGSGSTVSIAAGKGAIVYSDGAGAAAAVVDVTATFVPTLASLGITATAAELNILDGATLSTAELNTLDGITASTAELNVLDGMTASTAELNTLDGITASTADLNTASTHYVPSGGIIMWSGSVASIPTGWLLCDGNNGTPNLQDRFIVGAGNSYAVGATGGADSVTLSSSQIPAHTHTFSGTTSGAGAHNHTVPNGNSGGGSVVIVNGNARSNDNNTATSSVGNHTHTFSGTTSSAGSGSSHENRPPYYALAYIMKA